MKKKFVIIACALLLCCVTGKADLTVTVSIHSRLQVQGFPRVFAFLLALIIPQNRRYVLVLQLFLIVQLALIKGQLMSILHKVRPPTREKGAGGVIRTHDLLITKSGRSPESADFRRFRGLSARSQMVSGRLVSAVSIRSFPCVGQNDFRGFTKTVKICTGVTEE